MDDVFFAFDAEFAGFAGFGVRACQFRSSTMRSPIKRANASWRTSVDRNPEIWRFLAHAQCSVSRARQPVSAACALARPVAALREPSAGASITTNFPEETSSCTMVSELATCSRVASWRKRFSSSRREFERVQRGINNLLACHPAYDQIAIRLWVIQFNQTAGIEVDHGFSPCSR